MVFIKHANSVSQFSLLLFRGWEWGGGAGGQNEFMRQRISSLLIVSFRGPLWWPSEMLLSTSAPQGHLITPLSRVLLLVVLQQYLFGAAQ